MASPIRRTHPAVAAAGAAPAYERAVAREGEPRQEEAAGTPPFPAAGLNRETVTAALVLAFLVALASVRWA
jgi:hypothetical protein